MNNYDDLFDMQNPPEKQEYSEADKEEYAQRKKEERQKLYDMANDGIDDICGTDGKMQEYLNIQTRFLRYSVTNTLLIQQQKPLAVKLGDYSYWKEQGAYVKKEEFKNPIYILEPGKEYEREDGSIGVSYNAKKVYDVSQTTSRNSQRYTNYSDRQLLQSLLVNSPVQIKLVDDIPNNRGAYYDPEEQVIFTKRNLSMEELFQSLTQELAHAYEDHTSDEYDRKDSAFQSYCASYVLCRKYGINTENFDFSRLPERFVRGEKNEDEYRDIRGQLSKIQETAKNISIRMDRNLEKIKNKSENVR